MKYAEIKIQIYYDESKSTKEQQEQAEKADCDVKQEHPMENGIDDLRDTIEQVGLTSFRYLGEGIKAVKIEVE